MAQGFADSRVLIFGGAGFIGQHLSLALALSGAKVRCFDLNAPKPNSIVSHMDGQIEWVRGDFSEASQLERAVRGVDYIFHLVSTTLPDTSNRDLEKDLSSNVFSTLKLLEIIKSSEIKKLLFISSGGTVYGIPKKIPIPESHETAPLCGYGIHKLAIEKYLYLYNYNYGLDYCILRLSNPYGIAQISDRPQGVIGKFVYKAVRGDPLEIWGDGKVVRDYIYMDDVTEALAMAMRYEGPEKVFNVGSGVGHSLLEIIDLIEGETGRRLDVSFTAPRQSDVPLNVLDVSLIREKLGWEPKTDIRTGIRIMLDYGSGLMGGR